MREIRTLGLTWRGLKTGSRFGFQGTSSPTPPLVKQLVMRQACARLGPADSPIAWLAV